ncbi:Uncharacterized protein APZ42_021514 [Daphnia magna]|uniref:Uncharacterized protein n=1 Tax=Daphnia magna TaxID=35525 RepID=A0A164WLF9_9CRUS|nr:Uncharacterized protein APZ42_021514 [Daphnia magna]
MSFPDVSGSSHINNSRAISSALVNRRSASRHQHFPHLKTKQKKWPNVCLQLLFCFFEKKL